MRADDKASESYAILNIRVPRELYRLVQLHRVETGENATKLVNRLLVGELVGTPEELDPTEDGVK